VVNERGYHISDLILGDEDENLISSDMSNDCIVQTWFRFLHTIGNPVELTQPTIISQTQNFLQVRMMLIISIPALLEVSSNFW